MNEQEVKTYVFTNKDLKNVDFDRLGDEGLKARRRTSIGSRWYNAGFNFWLKDGRKLTAQISYDKSFVLKSKKYGEFKVTFLGKILSDFMQDNDELYIINRELQEIDDEWGMEIGLDVVSDRFDDLLFCEYDADVKEVARKFFEMATNGEKFITITDYVKQED